MIHIYGNYFCVAPRLSLYLTRCARVGFALFFIVVVVGMAGCANQGVDKTADWSAEKLYLDAKEEIAVGNWSRARTRLQSIESRYPFSIYAQQALMDSAYVNWKDGESDQAMAAVMRFQQLYPNHAGTDYMLYLKGLINFTPRSAFLRSVTGQDSSERDPKGLRQSYEAFHELLARFPNSKYAADAALRVTWLVNTIAMNELHVARYYYDRRAYVAAINRAQIVLTDFENTPAIKGALNILYHAYDQLGMVDLRDDIARVRQGNALARERKQEADSQRDLQRDPAWWNPREWF